MSHARSVRRVAALAVLATLIAGCGASASGEVPAAAPTPTTTGSPTTSTVPPPAQSATPTAEDDRGAPPSRLRIASIEIDSRIVPVGTTDRVLDIPPEPWVVGWWRDGVGPGGGRGTTVLVAHLDSREYGTGPFARVVGLRRGESATVVDREGVTHEYVVSSVDTYLKKALPYEELFAQRGPERIVLVTCGGEYRRDEGGWDSNVVVTLDPVSS